MSKYSIELNLEDIKYCIENHCGSNVCSKHFNIDSSLVKNGIDNLMNVELKVYQKII